MKKFLNVMKSFLGAVFLVLAPVAMMIWLCVDGCRWWVSSLAGLGVLMIISFLLTFFTSVAATIKGMKVTKKPNGEEKV